MGRPLADEPIAQGQLGTLTFVLTVCSLAVAVRVWPSALKNAGKSGLQWTTPMVISAMSKSRGTSLGSAQVGVMGDGFPVRRTMACRLVAFCPALQAVPRAAASGAPNDNSPP